MLVLSRRPLEKIIIGEGPAAVVVQVVSMDRGTVRVGVEAPRGVLILRGELVPPPGPPSYYSTPKPGANP
jgi:carbon storage regulator